MYEGNHHGSGLYNTYFFFANNLQTALTANNLQTALTVCQYTDYKSESESTIPE